MLPASRSEPIPATTASVQVLGGAAFLHGWALMESTGSAGAVVRFRDGTGTDGVVIAPISLTGGESTRDFFPGAGVAVRSGLFLEVVSGEVEGAAWVLPATLEGPFEVAEGHHPLWSGGV